MYRVQGCMYLLWAHDALCITPGHSAAGRYQDTYSRTLSYKYTVPDWLYLQCIQSTNISSTETTYESSYNHY